MRAATIPLLLAALCWAHANAGHAQDSALASPAIDANLFRAGEVTRLQRDFGGWRMVCDEVKKLRQRFCSLRSFAYDSHGKPVADIVVSTADNGRPAALLTLPYGVSLTRPVAIFTAPKGGKGKAARIDMRPVMCADDGCKIVWALTGADIAALRGGADFHVVFAATPALNDFPGPVLVQRNAQVVDGRVIGAGFDEAVLASLQ